MFKNKAYATVWNVVDKGKYCDVEMSTSKKNEDGEYETDFSSKYVRFVKTAADMAKKLKPKDRIQILECGVSNGKSDKDDKWYTSFLVFAAELADNAGTSKKAVDAPYEGDEDPI
jgi:hypothetical protein